MKNALWLLLAAAGLFFIYKTSQPTLQQMKDALRNTSIDPSLKNALTVMLPNEIVSLYDYFFNYHLKNKEPSTGSSLALEIQYLMKKYFVP